MSLRNDIRTLSTVFSSAEHEAQSLGDSIPGAEHVVLAALLLDDDSARDLLGVTADQFRAAIVEAHAKALEQVGLHATNEEQTPGAHPGGLYRSAPSTQEVLNRTREIHKAHKPAGLRAEFFVRAAAEQERGTTARVFDQLGIDRAALVDR